MTSTAETKANRAKYRRAPAKTLSQRGLLRQPQNASQRPFGEGGTKTAGTTLDAFNERQEARQLHPTNGWRALSVKRSRAQAMMAEIHAGRVHPLDTKRISHFIREGY